IASIARRRFTHLFGAGAAFAVARPALSLANPLHSDRAALHPSLKMAAGVVRLNSNENPYGPSPAALKAMTDAFSLAWRYPDEHSDLLIETVSKINGVEREQILLGDGSGEILKLCAAALTGPMSNTSRDSVSVAT